MTEQASALPEFGSLESFGEHERKSAVALLSACGLDEIPTVLGRVRNDPALVDHLAKLTWRAIRGRRKAAQPRWEITRQLDQLRAAVAALGEEAELALVTQGADVGALASQVARACAPDQNGRPLDMERHVLIAELTKLEVLSTGRQQHILTMTMQKTKKTVTPAHYSQCSALSRVQSPRRSAAHRLRTALSPRPFRDRESKPPALSKGVLRLSASRNFRSKRLINRVLPHCVRAHAFR
jgi:hypothetical protein